MGGQNANAVQPSPVLLTFGLGFLLAQRRDAGIEPLTVIAQAAGYMVEWVHGCALHPPLCPAGSRQS